MSNSLNFDLNVIIENFKNRSDIKIKEDLSNIGRVIWHFQASTKILNDILKVYDIIRNENKESLFWDNYIVVIYNSKDNTVICGLMELFLHIKGYREINIIYIDKVNKILFDVFENTDNEGIEYDIFSYLIDFEGYKHALLELIEKNKEQYKFIVPMATRIRKVDVFVGNFIKLYLSWETEKKNTLINLFLNWLKEESDNLIYISEKLKSYHLENNKVDLLQFFLGVLRISKQSIVKEGIELVFNIYQNQELLEVAINYNNEFVKNVEDASLLINDKHIHNLATAICKKSNYIEIAASYESELLIDKISKDNINIIDLYKRKKILNKPDTGKLAARFKVILGESDLIKLNNIYRKTKKARIEITELIKENLSYSPKELRILSNINNTNSNILEAVNNLGVQLHFEDFEDSNFTGCLFYFTKLRKAAIVINKNISTGKRNFTIAHELGHLASKEKGMLQFSEDSMYISYAYAKNEKVFDKFASEFLLPEEIIYKMIGNNDLDLRKIVNISIKLNTSLEAAGNRCISTVFERYVLAIYEEGKLQYASYPNDHLKELIDFEIRESIDENTKIFDIIRKIVGLGNRYISDKFDEDIELWFSNCQYNYKIKSQVCIQRTLSKRIMVLLQLPNKEYFK